MQTSPHQQEVGKWGFLESPEGYRKVTWVLGETVAKNCVRLQAGSHQQEIGSGLLPVVLRALPGGHIGGEAEELADEGKDGHRARLQVENHLQKGRFNAPNFRPVQVFGSKQWKG